MNDLQELYAALAREADGTRLDGPDLPRRRADRRRRARVVVTVAAVAALVAGITVGGRVVLGADGPPLPPSITSSPEPSRTPSGKVSSEPAPSEPAVPAKAIPDSAFLQQPDTNRADAPYEVPSNHMLPELCAAKYPSDALVQGRRTLHAIYSKDPSRQDMVPDGAFDETVTTYRADGATQFMQQLRAAVTACPSQTREGIRYQHRMLTAGQHGDEAILFEVRYPTLNTDGKPTGGEDVRLVSVVRVGTVVLVLYEQGWERGSSADRADVDRFTTVALSRLRAWLGAGAGSASPGPSQ
ncbi:hypothetical protein KZZ52_46035 [Dactylosporangium sp. AC04546]|uniref:hypothetical protein n=1 Tax=Dactylosporangium sp. AC04546 TaxID=2862460 RepID=UPI001EE0EA24|nr:hypothetical protein [Dactylosporangium sp. AC04546]WVK81276.1 hypothetical protein KZZ52_46035 [Dactylosporangium sp. AC04546]